MKYNGELWVESGVEGGKKRKWGGGGGMGRRAITNEGSSQRHRASALSGDIYNVKNDPRIMVKQSKKGNRNVLYRCGMYSLPSLVPQGGETNK